eukprot:scpid88924/ scgid28185/ 
MADSSKSLSLPSEEDIACDLQRAEDQAEEKLQNCLEDNENHVQHAFQRAAATVGRLVNASSVSSGRDPAMAVLEFQEAATAVTRLYKIALTSQRDVADVARRCGRCQRSREIYDSCRRTNPNKPFLRRDDVLSITAGRRSPCGRTRRTSLVSAAQSSLSSSPPASTSFPFSDSARRAVAAAHWPQFPPPSSPVQEGASSVSASRSASTCVRTDDHPKTTQCPSAARDSAQCSSPRATSGTTASCQPHRQSLWWHNTLPEGLPVLDNLFITSCKRLRMDIGDAEDEECDEEEPFKRRFL